MGILSFITGRNAKPDSPYSWFVALTGCIFVALMCGFSLTSGVLFVLIQDRYDVTKQKASYPVNVLVAFNFLFSIFSGPIIHRFKARKTLLLSSILGLIGSWLSIYSLTNDPITWLTICMALRGGGSSLAMPVVLQVVSSHFKKNLSIALMLVSLGFSIGGLVLPALVRSSEEEYGLESSWLIHGAVYCQSILLAVLIRPRREQKRPIKIDQELETFLDHRNRNDSVEPKVEITKEQGPRSDEESFGSLLAALFGQKTFYLLGFYLVVLYGSAMGVRTTVVDHGRDIDLDYRVNKYIMEILSISELARIPAAIIIDAGFCYEESLTSLALAVAALALLLMTLTNGYVFVTVACLYNVCFGVGVATSGTMFAALGHNRIATAFGITFTCSGAFQLALPFLNGLFRDNYGTYHYLYYLYSSLNLILAVAFAFSRFRHWFKRREI